LAILAAKSFAGFRPGGMKVLGGAVILEKGLTERDFEEMAKEGVRVVGEIGLGSVKSPEDAAPMVKWAKKYGMVVMMHTGGTSIPGSTTVGLDQVVQSDPDIVSHINGGPTAASMEEVEKLITQTSMAIEVVHCGNMKVAVEAGALVVKHKALQRVIIGNDAPSGTGVVPLGVVRVIALLGSMTSIKPEQAICMATGNTAKIFKLNRGIIEEGKDADLTIMDSPLGSVGKDALSAIAAGDVPGVSMVLVDGQIVVTTSRNTPPAVRKPTVAKA
jgi:enamidase